MLNQLIIKQQQRDAVENITLIFLVIVQKLFHFNSAANNSDVFITMLLVHVIFYLVAEQSRHFKLASEICAVLRQIKMERKQQPFNSLVSVKGLRWCGCVGVGVWGGDKNTLVFSVCISTSACKSIQYNHSNIQAVQQ